MIPWRVKVAAERLQDRMVDAALGLVTRRQPLPDELARRRVVLLGASVGKSWRLHLVYPHLRALCLYEFDKTPLLEQALAMGPDAIIIKECAAYFPDSGVRRELIPAWVTQIRQRGVRPVLATVVPVTRAHAVAHPGRQPALVEFNDWLRELARREQVPLLDLEAALRCSAADRHLDGRLHRGDGLHLSWRTYRQQLDPLIPPLLARVFAAELGGADA